MMENELDPAKVFEIFLLGLTLAWDHCDGMC